MLGNNQKDIVMAVWLITGPGGRSAMILAAVFLTSEGIKQSIYLSMALTCLACC